MNTPAHVIVNLLVLSRNKNTKTVGSIVIGSILSDIPMFLFYGWVKFVQKLPESKIWSEAYYYGNWQNFFDLFNSLPLFIVGYLIAKQRKSNWFCFFFASLMLHVAGDFLLHNDDAHRHFFPISDWRFQSPVSYWNPDHFGHIIGPIEAVIVILGIMVLVKWFKPVGIRLLFIAIGLVYALYLGFFVTWA